MKIVGIITEYNPFHHGHHYQLQQAKLQTQADVLVVLMSGNVVQRGEFAILTKWQRSQLALEYGADLVLELPLLTSMQSADYFAQIGVELLSKVGCETIVFGTETAKSDAILAYVKWYKEHFDEIQDAIQRHIKTGISYAAAMQVAIDDIKEKSNIADWGFDPGSANHLLGIQYMLANLQLEHPMEVVAIPRINTVTSLSETVRFENQDVGILSGSQIRQAWWNGKLAIQSIPIKTLTAFKEGTAVRWEDYWPLLHYQLNCHTAESLRQVFGIKEGLEYLLLKKVNEARTFSEFRASLVSKRWTQSSIQRILMAVLLNISYEEWEYYREKMAVQPAVRVLGYRPQGRKVLKALREAPNLDLFSNFTQAYEERYDLTIRADRILCLNPRVTIEEQNYSKYPIQVT